MKSSKKYTLLFFFIFISLCAIYNYFEVIDYPPYSNHTWRQADCLSITKNYYEDNLNFLTPEIHWVGHKGHGKTISEFPIIYFTVAKMWKLFGEHYYIYRIINILIVLFGLFSLYKLSLKLLKNQYWSFFIVFFLFTSPILIFYTNNFLSNAPAFALAMSGAYQYYLYTISKKKKNVYFAMFLFSLAALLKITSLFIFISILIYTVLKGFNDVYKKKKKFKTLISELLYFLGVIIIIIGWYYYARYYNSHNHQNVFLQTLFPIWELTPEKRLETFNLFRNNLVPAFFNRYVIYTILLLYAFIIYNYKKVNRALFIILNIVTIGILIYFVLFFRAFHVHDYYMVNLLIFIPLVHLTFFLFLKQHHPKIFNSIYLKIGTFILLLFLITQSTVINRLKYPNKMNEKFASIFVPKSQIDYWNYFHWSYNNDFKAFETVEPYLKSIGIDRDDKVFSYSDYSINITLYFMDRKGLTQYGYSNLSESEKIEFAIRQNCRYLIIIEKDISKHSVVNEYIKEKIGEYKNIMIYRI